MQQPGWYLQAPAAHVRRRSGLPGGARRALDVAALRRARRAAARCVRARTCASCRRSSSLSPDALIAAGGARARRTLLLLRPGGLRSRRSAAMESRSAHAPRRRRRGAPAPSTIAMNAWSATSSTCGRPNRHLHLATLAQAHALTGDARYALGHARAHRFLDRTVPGGPRPQLGAARSSSASGSSTGASPGSCSAARARGCSPTRTARRSAIAGCESIYEQARMIAGNLSRFSSANNHLIGEAAGVYIAASTWPLWPQMREWGERCREHPRRGMPPAERARRRQSRAGLRLPDLRARFPAARGARGARARRGFLACLLAPHRGHDRFPRVDDQRGGRAAHDRRCRRRLRGEPRARAGLLAAWLADRHRRGAVRPRRISPPRRARSTARPSPC